MLRAHQVKLCLLAALLVLSALLPVAAGAAPTTKRIEVNLTRQWLYAYQGNRLVLSSGVSTGRNGWRTPTGHFTIFRKVPLKTMRGAAKGITWNVPNVPNVMYFREGGFALHGTYWHHDFGNGIRHSHGCINLPLGAAAKLYAWAPIGTPVWVHC